MRPAALVVFLVGCGASAESLDDGHPAASYDVVIDASGVSGTLIVQNNGGDDLMINVSGSFTFSTRIKDGGDYRVTIKTQPAGQSCDVSNGMGTVQSAEVHVAIACTTNTYRVGGHLTGLTSTVQLTDNGSDPLALSADGDFFFSTRIAYQASYAVAVAMQPATSHCTVTMGSGSVPDADVTDVAVDCAPTYSVGGSVTGLVGSITIRDNGSDDVILNADGNFTFATHLPDAAAFHVTATGPVGQQCTIANGDGTIAAADVTNVAITCVDLHSIGGTVTGLLAGSTLVLEDNNNAGDLVTVTTDGMFTFGVKVAQGAGYSVAIATQPTGQLCTPVTTTGTVNGDITSVAITCRRYAVAIDEIYARPATGALGDTNGDNVRDSADDEFVEVINNEAMPVDVTGWVIATGSGAPVVRFTFPANSILPAGGRAVIFGGGTPGGSFGGALVFVAATGGLALTDAPATFTVQLGSAATGITLDAFTYDNTTFGSSCTTTCGSQTRTPSGTGAFGPHATAAGAPGILWSPGVAPTAAIPKLNTLLGIPPQAAVNVSVLVSPTAQFNMLMNPATLDNTHLKLYASPCSALANEITSFASVGPGSDTSKGLLVPTAALAYATVYCLAVDLTTHSAIDVALAASATVQFTTRAAASAPSTNVVISEVGGCRLGTSGTTTCTTAVSNDEFIELYNPTAAPIDISGWFLQRRSAGGSTTCAATIPATTTIAAGGFYLVGGVGYTAANYTGAPAADLVAAGSLIVGGSESVVLVTSAGTCTGSSNIVDTVSAGAITDTLAALELPAFGTTVTNNTSIERKACFDSTGDAAVTTGMLTGGGHALQGNSEHIGANNADWVLRAVPNPQDSASTIETRTCM